MKTYYDLVFRENETFADNSWARLFFENGYGVSVIEGSNAYGGRELAVFLGNEKNARITYDTPITNDVLGYLSIDDVTELMAKVAALPKYIVAIEGNTALLD